jgi:hypothetical protein
MSTSGSLHLNEQAEPLVGKEKAMIDAAVHLVSALSPNMFAGDNLITFLKTVGFTDDPAFVRAANAVLAPDLVRRMAWRLHTLSWAARMALRTEGDFVECGVFMGFKALFLMHLLEFNQTGIAFHLYDTFEGRPDKYPGAPLAPGTHKRAGLFEFVTQRFAPWPKVKIHKGIVPDDVIVDQIPNRISYLHLDMNAPEPERAALELMFDRMPVGGVVVLDDYGWAPFQDQKKAADSFFALRNHPVMELPTGQGMVVKTG